MAYRQTQAIARAKSWVGRSYPAGWCQRWVVSEIFASGGVGDWDGDRAADAEDGWKAARKRVATTDASKVPAGYPIYFTGGASDHGHAAVSAGGGYMYSTDQPYTGRVGKVPIKSVESAWGVKFVGYVITDGNGNTFTDLPSKPPAPAYTSYYVKAPFAFGHASPSATSQRVGNKKSWGTLLRVIKTTTVNGAKWAWVDPTGYEGRWYLLANLSTTKPTKKVARAGTVTIGEYNVAAQASGHSGTYPTRAQRSAKQMVTRGADVIGVVEYGSSSTKHADGRTFLEISDDARKDASGGNLARVAHGEHWRHILRRMDTTSYVAESGQSWTLPTRVDSDGTQIVAAAFTKDGISVKNGLVVFHFDVNSTTAQLKAQAKETLAIGEAWRSEHGVPPWNMTYVGDHNDTGSTVRAVFASHGFLPAARGTSAGKYRTTNSWEPVLTVGPRRDDAFVPEGTAEGYQVWLDAVAADHNYNQAVRAVYEAA